LISRNKLKTYLSSCSTLKKILEKFISIQKLTVNLNLKLVFFQIFIVDIGSPLGSQTRKCLENHDFPSKLNQTNAVCVHMIPFKIFYRCSSHFYHRFQELKNTHEHISHAHYILYETCRPSIAERLRSQRQATISSL